MALDRLCALALVSAVCLGGSAGLADARSAHQVREFRKTHPCPSTGSTRGSCKGFVVDHVVPLCWGGKDAPENMQWQDKKQSYQKDAFEREACKLKDAASAKAAG